MAGQATQNVEKQPTAPLDPIASLVGKIVAFVIYPDEAIPAKVTLAEPSAAGDPRIDVEATFYYNETVDGTALSGLMAFEQRERASLETRSGVRHNDPCSHLNPNHAPFRVPQPGHLTPGTWFDPAPWLVSIEVNINAIPEERLTNGRLLAAAKPPRRELHGPFGDYTEAYAKLRAVRAELEIGQKTRNETGSARMLWAARPLARATS